MPPGEGAAVVWVSQIAGGSASSPLPSFLPPVSTWELRFHVVRLKETAREAMGGAEDSERWQRQFGTGLAGGRDERG